MSEATTTTRREVRLGATDVHVAPLAVGTWSWGERRYWGYEESFGPRDVVDAFAASADAGVDLFDTAEVYGDGESEKILGWLLRKRGGSLAVATKFALLPGRDARTLPRALDAGLRRLGLPRVDLYQIHWPDRTVASIDALMGGLADAVAAGKARAVGVSNFSATEMREAHAALARRGVPLASNQVRYSLLHRAPEVDGVLDACGELGVTLLAYSPIAQGILTGKYAPGRALRPACGPATPSFRPREPGGGGSAGGAARRGRRGARRGAPGAGGAGVAPGQGRGPGSGREDGRRGADQRGSDGDRAHRGRGGGAGRRVGALAPNGSLFTGGAFPSTMKTPMRPLLAALLLLCGGMPACSDRSAVAAPASADEHERSREQWRKPAAERRPRARARW